MKTRIRSLGSQLKWAQFLIFVVFFIFFSVFYYYYQKTYTKKLTEINTSIVIQTIMNIERNTNNVILSMNSFSYNPSLQDYLTTDDVFVRSKLISDIRSLFINYKGLVPNLKGIIIKDMHSHIVKDTTLSLPEVNQILLQTENERFSQVFASAGNYYIALRIPIYEIGTVKKQIGKCIFILNINFLTDNVENISLDENSEFYFTDKHGIVIASHDLSAITHPLPEAYVKFLPIDNVIQIYSNLSVVAVSQKTTVNDWSFISITPADILFKELKTLQIISIGLCFLSFFFLYTIYFYIYKRTEKSAAFFSDEINQIQQGNGENISIIEDNLEFYKLSINFNNLLNRLSDLCKKDLESQRKIYEQKLENKKAQILALQSQINPHFLYNTLECMNSAGAVYGSWEIQEISVCLAAIFKYSINGSDIVTLNDELEIVRTYLKIQCIRFPDRFTVKFNVPQNVENKKILKFILQPIIENTIFHGIETTSKNCSIIITAEGENGILGISIKDSGIGISPERLSLIKQQLSDDSLSLQSIGLSNINKRIRLFYGDPYGISIESIIGKGTCVNIKIPNKE